ncbi:MAG: cation-translocating P-type ATPase [Promethearchaeota archaeon]
MSKPLDKPSEPISYEECLELLGADVNGLTEVEAESLLAQYGFNELTKEEEKNPIFMFIAQFKSPLVYVLFFAAVISLFMEELIDFFVILAILFANAVIGFTQEWKSEKTIRAIHSLIEDKAIVIRDGDEIEIPAENIVPGDIMLLSAGQKVPADARILFERNLHVDESLLTGESVPIKKDTACLIEDPYYYEQVNLVFSGSFVTEGRARVIVTATGDNTELGKIHKELQKIREKPSPMAVRTKRLSLFFLGLALLFFGLVIGLGLYRGIEGPELALLALASLVSSIPEGLLAVLTIVLAIGITRLARQNVIVRNLGTVETLGITNVICSDKTGTLTKNEMMVRRIYTKGQSYEASGSGYDPLSGGIYLEGYGPEGCLRSPGFCYPEEEAPPGAYEPINKDTLKQYPYLERLLRYMALANDAEVYAECEGGGRCTVVEKHDAPHFWRVKGSPTEAALIVALEKVGLHKHVLDEMWPRIAEIPFSSARKYMATLHELGPMMYDDRENGREFENKNLVIVKGAPEALQNFAVEMPAKCQAIVNEYASQGLRILACAVKYVATKVRQITKDDLEGIEFVGLVGINDPPREEVRNYIEKSKLAGISVKMITGDNELTANAIAEEIGLLNPDSDVKASFRGDELDQINDEELKQVVADAKVFSRTNPIHKLRIVKALQEQGSIVAMTGDGINDSPALKQADIGIAMGITGTDIAKEAADVILQDEKFEAVVDGIDQGRHIFNNFRRVALYLLSTNIGEDLLLILTLAIFLHPVLLLPIQILWINLATDGFLDISLAMEPKEEGLLDRPPKSLDQRILSKDTIKLGIFYALIMSCASLAFYLYLIFQDTSAAEIRTAIFMVLIVFQWFNVFNCRSHNKSVFTIGVFKNKTLWFFLVIDVLLVVILFIVPPLAIAFDIVPLGIMDWIIIVLISSSIWIIDEIRKKLRLFTVQD